MRGFILFTLACLTASALMAAGCSVKPASSGVDYLTERRYSRLIVEIDYQGTDAPRDTAVELLKARIEERCNKAGGIEIQKTSFADSRTTWSTQDIKNAESDHRDHYSGGDTAVLYILYLSGSYSTDGVLGVAYSRSSYAVFKDEVDGAGLPGPLPVFSAVDVERSVIVHEFGHILGLVNLGTPMVKDHEDKAAEHRGHSKNKNSVMYWAIESLAIRDNFNTAPPTQFDADDIADLRNVGGK